MEASRKLKVSEIFTRYQFSKEDAHFISDVLDESEERQNQKFEIAKDSLLSQKDKVELINKVADVEIRLTEKIADVESRFTERINAINKTIYVVGLVQFLAIIASVLAIINFRLK